jgi:hypothetical protein
MCPPCMTIPKNIGPLNGAFVTELYDLVHDSGQITGSRHHHFNIPSVEIGVTNLLANQLAYVSHGEHKFNKGAVIEVPAVWVMRLDHLLQMH